MGCSPESLSVLGLTNVLPSVPGTSSGDSVLCYKTDPSLSPVLLSLTPHFHSLCLHTNPYSWVPGTALLQLTVACGFVAVFC